MKIAWFILIGVTVFVATAAPAQQARTGMITQVNRLDNTVAIRPMQNGTVGTNSGGAAETFKVGTGISLDALHAGDVVNYSASETGGSKAIVKLEKR